MKTIKLISLFLIFLIAYIIFFIGLEIVMKEIKKINEIMGINYLWLPGQGGTRIDGMFRFEQCVYSIPLFLIYYIFKKRIDCKSGFIILLLTFLVNAFLYYKQNYGHTWTDDFMADAVNYFFHDYLFTVKGIVHLESAIIVAFLLAWLIYKLTYNYWIKNKN